MLENLINPFVLYIGLVLWGLGVCMALPRKRVNPQVIGAVVAGLGFGVVLLGFGIHNPAQIPNINFYIFGIIAVGGALRVITHPRPVYAALYFIMTILASCGLYLILSAEFMAFALVIIYAGAILITYLFVIMLATQAPVRQGVEMLAEYDTTSHAPIVASIAGFVLLAGLTTMLVRGVDSLPEPGPINADALLGQMPGKTATDRVEASLFRGGKLHEGEHVVSVDVQAQSVVLSDGLEERQVPLPDDIGVSNVEAIGFDLLNEYPGSIEIAGVILLMAMLGATVLCRKQVEFEDQAKHRQAQALAAAGKVFADKEVMP